MSRTALLASCAWLALCAGAAHAGGSGGTGLLQAVDVIPASVGTDGGGSNSNQPTGPTFLWPFTANSQIEVTQLGYYNSALTGAPGDGGFGSPLVTLTDFTTNTTLATINVSNTDPVTGAFNYATLSTPVILNTTDTYVISAQGTPEYYLTGLTLGAAQTATQINYEYQSSYGDYSNFGPNFEFVTLAQPTSTCTENVPGRNIIALSGDHCVAAPGAYNPTVTAVGNLLPVTYNGFGFFANGGSIDSPGNVSITTSDPQGTGGSIAIWSDGPGSLITTEGTTKITTVDANSIGVYASDGGVFTATGNVKVNTSGAGAFGVNADGSGSTITLGDAKIKTTGQGAVGLLANDSAGTGSGGTIVVNGNLKIKTQGQGSDAIWSDGSGANITTYGTTKLKTAGDNSIGVYASGGGQFTANGDLIITTGGAGAFGVNADGSVNGSPGSASTITLGNTTITTNNTDTSHSAAVGLFANDSAGTGLGGSIIVNGTLNVTTQTPFAYDVFATSAGSTITLNGVSTLTVAPGSFGLYATVGGAITTNSSLNINDANTGFGGGVEADSGALITLNGASQITLTGTGLVGVFATGGEGGIGTVTTTNTLTVTAGANSGLVAQGGVINLGGATTVTTTGAGPGADGVVATGGGQILSSSSAGALSVSTTGAGAYAIYATGSGSTINVTLGAVSTSFDATPAVVADKGASVTISGGTVGTSGQGGAWGLWADGTGTSLTATNVQVTTTGNIDSTNNVALGAYATNGATMSLTGVTINTSGAGAHGVESGGGSSIAISGGSVTTGGANAFGLFSTDPGSSITTSNGVVVSTTGNFSNGVFVYNGASASLTGGSVTTTGIAASGVSADGAGSSLTATGVTISTSGNFDTATGYQSQGAVAGDSATATLNNDTITTTGAEGQGVLAATGGKITISGGSVTVSGVDTDGLLANGQGSTITTSGGLVVTSTATPSQNSIQGARADNYGALVLADTTITTSGTGVAGVGVDTNGTASLNNVGVATTGDNAYGASAVGAGALTIGDGTQLTTGGANAHGLYVSGAGSTAKLSGAVGVTVTGDGAAGVLVDGGGAVSSTGGTLTVNAANYGLYVNGGAAATSINLAGSLSLTTNSTTGAAIALNGDNASFTGTGGGTINAAGIAIAFVNGVSQSASFTGYTITSGGDLIFSDPSTATVNFTNTSASAGTGNLADVTNGSTLTVNAVGSTLTGAFETSAASEGTPASVSNFNLSNGSSWTVTGSSTVTNLNVANSSVTFAPTGGFKELVTTNYTGSGATMTFNAALGGTNPSADLLVINGGGATGTTTIKVNPISVASGPTDVALVTTANGGTIAPGAFTLSGPLVVDGTGYTLQGSSTSENLVSAMSTSSASGSVASLAESRQTAAITGKVLGSILTGATEQINCSSCSSGFASFGSFALGAHGRWTLTPSLALLAGASYDSYSGRGVTVNSSLIGAAALRYDPAEMGRYRPFVEAGLLAQPYADITFRRSYQTLLNGGAAAVGVGDTTSESVATYGRVGYIWRLSRVDEAAAYTDLTRSWQWTGGYTESATPGNPFGAQVAPSLDTMNVWRVGGQYTHLFGEHIEANISLAYARAFDASYGGSAAISVLGTVTGAAPTSFDWGEWGARLSYRFSNTLVGDAFVLGTVGAQPVGNQVHGGVALRMEF
jgi:hypothetical protein